MIPGLIRFVAKQDGRGLWGVYDRVMASWPIVRNDLGIVQQNLSTEAEAQAEADRCNELMKGKS